MYEVKFPYGITQAEVTKFFEETAGMSPDEQQDIIDGTVGGANKTITFDKDYLQSNLNDTQLKKLADKTGASSFWTGAEKDINRLLDSTEYMNRLNELVQEARDAEYEDDEIIDYLTN
jgi:hypothetical protein